MTFGDEYLTHLRVIQNIGMARIDPVKYKGVDIIPLEFLKAVLPDPGELGENYTGQTSIGCRIKGIKVIKLHIRKQAHREYHIQLVFLPCWGQKWHLPEGGLAKVYLMSKNLIRIHL